MKLFDILNILNPDITPGNAKLHLAGWNGEEDPLEVYLQGQFEEWQCWQTRKNFPRKYVVSLINLNNVNTWLFAGVYVSSGNPEYHDELDPPLYKYILTENMSCHELNGRLVVSFVRPGRQSYLNSENWAKSLVVDHITKERRTIGEFPGFKAVHLSFNELKMIVNLALPSWKSALSSVAGVYLIADSNTGKLYVGSATGEGGIWQRWVDYVANGHGGNVELKKLVSLQGQDSLSYAILEIADTHASQDEIIQRENHWKNVLMTRQYGLNLN